MSHPRLAIVREPLSVEALAAGVATHAQAIGEGCGAVATFIGVVRKTHQGRAVRYLEYEAFEPLALKALAQIEREIGERWPHAVLGLVHRIGRLGVGEASVIVAIAAAHRSESFQACRYAIERVKQIVPVWKHEFFEDGDAWVEGAIANPEDEHARQEALARACA